MAARDRFGTGGHSNSGGSGSQLLRLIQGACDPVNYEPNLPLCFQISDLINEKKGNAPREAAVAIVNLVNHRNPNVSLLALGLLDICVKNCGYPFHLQISTKDFLNELVRRFPERPPPIPTRVQQRILQMIEEWRNTICHNSRYKDDLGFIRDMHRLLSYKGYVFPQVSRDVIAFSAPAEVLKSAEEMEAEERAAQQAKLQELIRRGTPQDLAEANHLMKVLVGYDQESKTDYRAKAAEEVGKLRHKARLLEEMLVGIEKGDKVGEQDIFDSLASSLKRAQPKIRKIIEEESDDTEAVNKLLELNDNINGVLERYNLIKKGDIDAAKRLPTVTTPTPAGGKAPAPPKQEVSLIDLGDEDFGSSSTKAAQKKPAGNALEDDLLGLSLDSEPTSFGQGGGIALGFGAHSNIPGPPLLSSTLTTATAGQTRPISSAGSRSATPNYAAFGQEPAQPDYSNSFASLGSLKPSPAQQRPASQSSTQPTTNAFSGLGQFMQSKAAPKPQPAPQAAPQDTSNGSGDGDDWDFVAAVPASEPIQSSQLTLLDNKLKVVIGIGRPESSGPIVIEAIFSNNTSQLIHDLTFSMAVMKHLSLKMESQSGRALQPHQQNGITQTIMIHNVAPGQGPTVKVRWKASYKVGITGGLTEEVGTIDSLPIA